LVSGNRFLSRQFAIRPGSLAFTGPAAYSAIMKLSTDS
jgi:hypothetical protein